MNTPTDQQRRRDLGAFLRSKREAVAPERLGIAVRRRRRAPGLLREEVADHAGVSVTWYTWLEQARPTNPSARVLDGLAQALCLDATERRHLFRLARPDLDPGAAAMAQTALTPVLQSLLHGLAPHPVYAVDARWDVVAWNAPAGRVFGDFAHLPAGERNILHRLFLDPAWQALFVDIEHIAASAVAQFRAAAALHDATAEAADLVETLSARSPAFKALWASQRVAPAPDCRKVLRHPEAGLLSLDYATFHPDSGPADLRFTIYTAADAETAARIAELLRG